MSCDGRGPEPQQRLLLCWRLVGFFLETAMLKNCTMQCKNTNERCKTKLQGQKHNAKTNQKMQKKMQGQKHNAKKKMQNTKENARAKTQCKKNK
jgi:multidrug resistance efflux pump